MSFMPLLAKLLQQKLNQDRGENRTHGDVRIEIIERGNRVVSLKVHHNGKVPDTLGRFAPEVREKAANWWWSSSRERRILKAAKSQGRLVHDIVRGALLHDRAVYIEQRLQKKRPPRQPVTRKNLRSSGKPGSRGRAVLWHNRGASSTALGAPPRPEQLSLADALAARPETQLAEPRILSIRGRGR